MLLQVAQPQEGSKIAVCAKSRYEFELFSGTVSNTPKSEALNAGEGSLWQRLLRRRDVAQANHSVVIRAPAGESRTFRVATNTEKLPAKVKSLVVMCFTARFLARLVLLLNISDLGTEAITQ